jgi:hypothetical protein
VSVVFLERLLIVRLGAEKRDLHIKTISAFAGIFQIGWHLTR